MTRKPNNFAGGNEPLGRIILVPLDRISVIHGELVVEIVVSFTNGNESGDNVVPRRMLVVKGGFAEVVCEGVDAECALLIGDQTPNV